jgi:hypothetical protein
MDPNPYESPRTPEPLKPGKVIKRSIGAVAILLLTPVAVGIALGVSCSFGTSNSFILRMLSYFGNVQAVYFAAWSVVLIPPALVLIGMLWLAVRVHNAGGGKS